ncbi:MAG: hypothetical protein WAU88_07365 [Candidatus Zixiibacteriota bacterium]
MPSILASTMRKYWISLSFLIVAASIGYAQNPVSLPPVKVLEFRPKGDQRIWTFISRDSTLGQLVSTVLGKGEVADLEGIVISEDLSLDFRKSGGDLNLAVNNKHLVSEDGRHLADSMTISVNDQQDTLRLARVGDSLKGYGTRGGVRQPVSLYSPVNRPCWDQLFLDQLELYLACRGVAVGDNIQDSVIAVQAFLSMPLAGTVQAFAGVSVSRGRADSAFGINFSLPQQMHVDLNRSRRLVKAEFPQQNLRVYLDLVTNTEKSASPPSPPFLDTVVPRVPAFLVTLIVGAAALLFFVKRRFTWSLGYLAAGIGAALYWIVPVTQMPLQRYAIIHGMLPALKSGSSIFLLATMPALIAGVIQTLILGGLILVLKQQLNVKYDKLLDLGAFCGLGFGLMEAFYLLYTSPAFDVWSYAILERTFILVFHVSAGLLLANALKRDFGNFMKVALILIPINSLFRYLPIFVQQRVVGVEILSIMIAFVGLSVVFAALLASRTNPKDHASTHPVKHS